MKRFPIVCAAAALALAGCSATNHTTETPDAHIDIVATTSVWADVASAVAGDDATVTPIISKGDVDPHSFEPVASDMATLERADIIVANGGGYDAWAYANLGEEKKDAVVSPLPLTPHEEETTGDPHGNENSEHHHEHGSEHVWYDTHAIEAVMDTVAAKITELGGTATVDEANAKAEALEKKVQELPAGTVMQTEPIADSIIEDSALTDATPQAFREATLKESEPSATALDEFLTTLKGGGIDVLIFNPSTATDTTKRIREAAEEAHVKIVEIAEVPPTDTNFLDYFDSRLTELKEALS
ncbi:metal ABC transporter solute-binding protein, Zn/Mn family [Corynebacterium pyruviciproducens]|uniref:metal ABC transporter solute-binding protein, Zn/Mn family n=1 Tax=Corynebacterium pyruviciproducens TaxID=598660 RepID=UPI0023F1A817|nr:zinc ABC transporter substrate-binding protein [Corynebacterium pyruviciproducens]